MSSARVDDDVEGFGPFTLDRKRRVLTRDGEPVALRRTEFDTLAFLLLNRDRIVTKDELLDAVWSDRIVEESSVSQAIYKLRTALGDKGMIVTEPGIGYRFTGPTAAKAPTPAKTSPIAAAFSDRARAFQLGLAFGAVLLAVSGGFVALQPWSRTPHGDANSTVVFADFLNQTGDPVFNGTVSTAAQIDMRQSPHLTVMADQRIQETLGLMMRPKDTPLTPAVAREVCARNNAQAVIDGSVAKIGERYLLTLTATGCVDGQVIVADKADAASREALLPALDQLVDRVRRRLGESAASIEKFNVPLASRRTASLEALKAYSEATYLDQHGRRVESIALYKRAIELDPNFAMAYADLGNAYLGLHDEHMIDLIAKAFALRDLAGEHDKLLITIRYGLTVQRDQIEALQLLRTMANLYPSEAWSRVTLADRQDWIGLRPADIQDAQTAIALDPDSEPSYAVLARLYMHAGRFDLARSTCAQAVARHLDGDRIHKLLFEIAFAQDDDADVAREVRWAQGKPGEEVILVDSGQAAASRGQMRLAETLFGRAVSAGKKAGIRDWLAAPYARLLNDVGLNAEAKRKLAEPPLDDTADDYRAAMAAIGDPQRAEALTRDAVARSPHDTKLNVEYAPVVRATLALRRGKPSDAIEALKGSSDYELSDFDIPYLRGQAYLAAGDGAHAAIEFGKILDNRGVRPLSVKYPLARLGLARALHLQGKLPESRKAYEQFLTAWRNADTDVPVLQQAKAEYARLQAL